MSFRGVTAAMELISSNDFARAKFCRKPVAKPECEHTPRGEWYCPNEDCVVREVEISVKLFGEPMPAAMKCPACGIAMKFHNWVEYEMFFGRIGSCNRPNRGDYEHADEASRARNRCAHTS
jgi:hypothetical protein